MAAVKRLTYWFALCLDDRPCYSIRTRTRRECQTQRRRHAKGAFGPPRKVTVEYADEFDLLQKALGEGGVEPLV